MLYPRKILSVTVFIFCSYLLCAQSGNVISNGDFSVGEKGKIPDGWVLVAQRPEIAPLFYIEKDEEQTFLLMKGKGQPTDVGYLLTKTTVQLGQTYEFKVLFSKSDDINPQRNLLFQCKGPGNHDGIMDFYQLDHGKIEGRTKIYFPGNGEGNVQIRLYYRLHAAGEVRVFNVSLSPTEHVVQRWVRVACTSGRLGTTDCIPVIEQAAANGVDILLLPEYLNGDSGNRSTKVETFTGETCTLLAAQAKEHQMFIAGGFLRMDETTGNRYNTFVMYDRKGQLVGFYDKIHLYSPEYNDYGYTPGHQVKVFDTEFGKIGAAICSDNWFTDVAELLALKGAEIILYPNAGYYKSLIPARSADNRVRFVISSLHDSYGIFDTLGRDIQHPDRDPSLHANGKTFDNIKEYTIGNTGLLIASLDLNCSPSPHYNGGTMMEAPGGKRNRSEPIYILEPDILKEKERWWK